MGQGKEVFLGCVDDRAGAYGEIQSRGPGRGAKAVLCKQWLPGPGNQGRVRWHSEQEELFGQLFQVLRFSELSEKI